MKVESRRPLPSLRDSKRTFSSRLVTKGTEARNRLRHCEWAIENGRASAKPGARVVTTEFVSVGTEAEVSNELKFRETRLSTVVQPLPTLLQYQHTTTEALESGNQRCTYCTRSVSTLPPDPGSAFPGTHGRAWSAQAGQLGLEPGMLRARLPCSYWSLDS